MGIKWTSLKIFFFIFKNIEKIYLFFKKKTKNNNKPIRVNFVPLVKGGVNIFCLNILIG
jgi:hypothetical protein